MIHFITPYSANKSLANVYNYYASKFDRKDWICFTDADAMFLSPFFGQQLEAIIKQHGKDYLAFTCMTNRVGNLAQCVDGRISTNTDISYHITRNKTISRAANMLTVTELPTSSPLSGVMILSKVSTMQDIPFRGNGMLGVDNNFHYDIAKKGKFGLMKGVYMFHKYRLDSKINDKSHLL